MRGFAAHGIIANIYAAGDQPVLRHALLSSPGSCWIDMDNQYVGRKWNAAAQAALDGACDYLLMLGSDDFVSDGLLEEYAKAVKAHQEQYLGLTSIYVAEPSTRRLMLLEGRMKQLPDGCRYTRAEMERRAAGEVPSPVLGAGRLMHHSLFAGHSHFWEPKKNKGLDANITHRLGLPEPRTIRSDPKMYLVDVKTSANIWSYDTLTEWFPDSPCGYPGPMQYLPEWPTIEAYVGLQP